MPVVDGEQRKIVEEVGADGRPTGVEDDGIKDEPREPFDPKSISIEAKPISMDALIRRLLQGTICLAPAFQRHVVWDEGRQSRLIESLMLKIPLPMFYVAADEKGNWDVVDGLQRLTALRNFVLGEIFLKTNDQALRGHGMRLKELEFWGKEYNGCTFNDLSSELTNDILETELRFTIIHPGTPDEVKFTIFKRLNTGGMPLSPQEIRHALYQGQATKLLKELVESDAYVKATGGMVNDSRMTGQELCLRFLAFSLRDVRYYKKSDMDFFLNETMRIINCMPELKQECLKKIFTDSEIPKIRTKSIESLRSRFEKAMHRSFNIFGRHTFRKSYGNNRRAPINKTLFETWGNILADLTGEEYEKLLEQKATFMKKYSKKLDNDDFANIIAKHSLKPSSVLERYKELRYLVKSTIETE